MNNRQQAIEQRIFEITGKTAGYIRSTTLPNRIALQHQLISNNERTAELIVDAVVRNADLRIQEGLILVYDWEKMLEGTEHLPLQIYELRNFLESLL